MQPNPPWQMAVLFLICRMLSLPYFPGAVLAGDFFADRVSGFHEVHSIFLPAGCLSDGVREHRKGSDMSQEPLFFEDWRDALRHVVAALGGAKVVAARMRPEMKPDHAARWLNDCLNHDRRESLHVDHLMHLLALARQRGLHSGMAYIAAETGYKVAPVEPTDERMELMRQYVEAARAMKNIASRIEAVESRAGLKVAV